MIEANLRKSEAYISQCHLRQVALVKGQYDLFIAGLLYMLGYKM
jgi:hypothetical protein